MAVARNSIEALSAELGPKGCLHGTDLPDRHRTDWSFLPPAAPIAVLRPASTNDLSKIMRHCHDAGIPVTAQGGLTGLCGGARPLDGGVALSLERMTGIEALDPDGMTMTVLAGTPLETIQKAATEAGLFFPARPWCPRLLHHRWKSFDQCWRQQGHPLWNGAGSGAWA